MAAIDTHIKFDGVEGESTNANHKGEIEVLSWNWSVTNDSQLTGGGSGKGKATPGNLVFTHKYDKASPNLAKKSIQGIHFKEVMLSSAKSGDGQKDFLKVKLTEVYVTSVKPSQSGSGEILEEVSLSYASIEFAYKAQDDKGALGGEVKYSWNNKTTVVT